MIHCTESERDGVRLATLRMEHGKANAIDIDLFDALTEHLERLEPSDVDAVILTGTGRSFSAGVDLFAVLDGGAQYLSAFVPTIGNGIRRLFTFSKPLVAALNGHAIAGGCILALACDRRVAVDQGARFGVTELKVGVAFPVAAMEVLRYHLSAHVAQDLVLSGRTVASDEALALGLVEELAAADHVLERAQTVAAELGRVPHGTYSLTKRQLRRDAIERIDRSSEVIDEEILHIWSDPEILADIRAFMSATVGKTGEKASEKGS